MPNPQIVWCAQSSLHYVVEDSTRYAMPLFLAIQLKEHLKICNKKNNNGNKKKSKCVAEWISHLNPQDRILVQINRHQAN